jgi:hypothetical protein
VEKNSRIQDSEFKKEESGAATPAFFVVSREKSNNG